MPEQIPGTSFFILRARLGVAFGEAWASEPPWLIPLLWVPPFTICCARLSQSATHEIICDADIRAKLRNFVKHVYSTVCEEIEMLDRAEAEFEPDATLPAARKKMLFL